MNNLSFEVLHQSKCFAPSVLLVCLQIVLFHSVLSRCPQLSPLKAGSPIQYRETEQGVLIQQAFGAHT